MAANDFAPAARAAPINFIKLETYRRLAERVEMDPEQFDCEHLPGRRIYRLRLRSSGLAWNPALMTVVKGDSSRAQIEVVEDATQGPPVYTVRGNNNDRSLIFKDSNGTEIGRLTWTDGLLSSTGDDLEITAEPATGGSGGGQFQVYLNDDGNLVVASGNLYENLSNDTPVTIANMAASLGAPSDTTVIMLEISIASDLSFYDATIVKDGTTTRVEFSAESGHEMEQTYARIKIGEAAVGALPPHVQGFNFMAGQTQCHFRQLLHQDLWLADTTVNGKAALYPVS